MTARENEAWNWQVWKIVHGKNDEWMGFFGNEKDALAWTKSQNGFFIVNNCPPPRIEEVEKKDYRSPRSFRPEVAGTVKVKPYRAPAAKPVVKAAPETAEQRKLRVDAEQRLDKIKVAEAKDLVDGKNG